MKKHIRLLAALLVMTMLLCGCEILDKAKEYSGVFEDALEAEKNPGKTKTYTNAGVSFQLPNTFLDFTGTELGGDYPFLYANETIGILGVQENKEELFNSFGEMDLMGYAQLIVQLYNLDATPTTKDGHVTITYETEADDKMQTYTCVFFETDGDFWNMQSYCETELYEENKDSIWSYLTSATFE